MSKDQEIMNVEQLLDRIREAAQDENRVSWGAILEVVGRRSFGPLLLVTGLFTLAPIIGDQIVIGDTEGGVERINLRATQIRTYDGRAVLAPNGEVFTSHVTNNTESPIRRGAIEVPLGYESFRDRCIIKTLF